MLLVQMQPPATLEDEFHSWYDTEHVPEREALPGFLTATRYVCVAGWPRYMACYDLASLGELQSEAYKRIGGPNLSVWSKRVIARVVGYERLELTQEHPADGLLVEPGNGKVMLRFATPDLELVTRGAEALAAGCPAAQLRVFENALPADQSTVMLDAAALELIPEWSPAQLAEALGEAAPRLVAVSRYRRYKR